MARINKTQYALLNMLNKHSMSGYDAKHFCRKISKLYWTENNAQIYSILKELEQKQFVKSEIDSASGKRQRRIYSITNKGKQYLIDWIERPTELPPYREELLLKLSGGHMVDNAIILKQLQEYKKKIQEASAFQQQTLEHIKHHHQDTPYYQYLLMNNQFSKYTLEAKLKWIDECLIKMGDNTKIK
jgi:DNA-binding PadR family transcriptional regulator